MKYIKQIIASLLLLSIPVISFGLVATWQATSSTPSYINPTAINGVTPPIAVPGILSTASSTISAPLHLTTLSDGCATLSSGLLTSTGSACGGSQTPWTADESASGFNLNNLNILSTNNVHATSTSGINYFLGHLGIGTTTNTELFTIDRPASDNDYTTMLAESGIVKGIFSASTPDLTVFSGSKSNHPFNLVENNNSKLQLDTSGNVNILSNSLQFNKGGTSGSTYQLAQQSGDYMQVQRSGGSDNSYSEWDLDAPAANPQEATMTTGIGSGAARQFVDWTMENYGGLDDVASINVAKSGATTSPPFAIRFWNKDTVAHVHLIPYSDWFDPSGSVAFGYASSTNVVSNTNRYDPTIQLQVSSSTAPTVFAVDSSPRTHLFQVGSNGNVIISSTTATATIGGALFGGAAPIAGLGTSNSQLVISQNVNNLARQLDLANTNMGANAVSSLTFENGNSTNAGASSQYIAGLVYGGPNFATPGFGALGPNGLALYNTNGPVAIGPSGDCTSPIASTTLSFYAGNNGGFGGGQPDVTLLGCMANLGIATTSPSARFAIQGAAGTTTPLMLISSSTAAFATSTVLTVTNTGGLILSSFATTTANNGFNITSGCFSIAGTCVSGGGGGAVSSVSNSDSSLTISPTTGSVVASINLAHTNAFTAAQSIQSGSVTAFAVGANGVTNPAFLVDSGILTPVTGLDVQAKSAGSGIALSTISSGTNENMSINAKGTGNIILQNIASGNVGIASSTPGSLLSVGNTNGINFTTATTSFSSTGGINIASGCFAVGGACLTTGGSGTVGSGTTGQTPYYAANGTTLTATSTLFFNNNGTLGIATTTGTAPLSIEGNLTTVQGIRLDNGPIISTGGNNFFIFGSGTYSTVSNVLNNFNGNEGLLMKKTSTGTGDYFEVQDSSANTQFIIKTTGLVGIASSSPLAQLSLNSVAGSPSFAIGSSTGTQLIVDKNGSVGIGTAAPSGGKVQILQSIDTNAGGLTVTNSTAAASNRIWMDATGNARIDAGGSAAGSIDLNGAGTGKVGIGTTTPYATLSVQSGASTGDAFVIATSTGNAVFGVDNDGHHFTSGPAPVISTCGTGTGTVVGDDQSGTITTATAATACTMTFSKAYRLTPTCTVTDNSLVGFADVSSVSVSAVTFGISSALTGGNLYYNCQYHK